ncbi:uncharacterized protein JCM15063_001513 [Sporobolomyces koalae]|uniref:uncharacterized protein n=1 Tax=Sporobolomyces koalae TaxID=500713 RepID=UPI00317D4002
MQSRNGKPQYCQCGCTCQLVKGSNPPRFVIRKVEEQHTCDPREQELQRDHNRARMARIIEKLEQAVAHEGHSTLAPVDVTPSDNKTIPENPKKRKRIILSDADIRSDEEEVDQLDDSADNSVRKRVIAKEDSGSEVEAESSEESSEGGSNGEGSCDKNRAFYPSLREVQDQVKELCHTDPEPALPSTTERFDSATSLLVRVYAHAESRGFNIYRYSPFEIKTSVKMICRRGHSRWAQTPEGRCNYAIRAAKTDTGQWQFVAVDGQHNHEPQESIFSSQRDNPIDSAMPLAEHLSQNIASSRKTSMSPISELVEVKPTPPANTFETQLIACLRALEPQLPDHTSIAQSLMEAGIASISDLAMLFCVEDSTLKLFESRFLRGQLDAVSLLSIKKSVNTVLSNPAPN